MADPSPAKAPKSAASAPAHSKPKKSGPSLMPKVLVGLALVGALAAAAVIGTSGQLATESEAVAYLESHRPKVESPPAQDPKPGATEDKSVGGNSEEKLSKDKPSAGKPAGGEAPLEEEAAPEESEEAHAGPANALAATNEGSSDELPSSPQPDSAAKANANVEALETEPSSPPTPAAKAAKTVTEPEPLRANGEVDRPTGLVSIAIETMPEGARVIRKADGVTLGTTPYTYETEPAAGMLRFDLELEGHRSKTLEVPGDKDSIRQIVLLKN